MNERSLSDANQLVTNVEAGVAILRLNRPDQANALNSNLFTLLTRELEEMRWDTDVRAVVITGEGDKDILVD